MYSASAFSPLADRHTYNEDYEKSLRVKFIPLRSFRGWNVREKEGNRERVRFLATDQDFEIEQ